ncbi:DDE-type integrase/transposase/recombinase [Algoriphagus sp. H41]|uniref:DDE-type integrase/transposase/recombinase n=1 Tax=Algoriphagus oliviformis TaxID=2811231 RepID=A0ABS3C9C7_9BACT|nr:DDE-type integrase/transposase/recombinase [Algoriphagus oliviformis]MBN7813718.1 DDE-type integrase/transposase/recombinase [Algoriphagus oliviformis]
MSHTYAFTVGSACEILGFTRQAYYKKRKPRLELDDQVVEFVTKKLVASRERCPTVGCRSMYGDFGDQLPLGRDKSIELFMDLGFRVKYPKRYGRATQSGTRAFPNLLAHKDVKGINQVWQADMAHYLYGDSKLYTIYITDVYSQEIVGYGAYDSNIAENYAEVLEQAIGKSKRGKRLKGLIHHSDGGKQYESELYRSICRKHEIEQSMCMYSYENPYAEKTNDLVNNGYLNSWKPRTLKELKGCQSKAVKDHNTNRRKQALGNIPPVQFRKMLQKEKSITGYTLELKPRIPEQPKKKNPLKTEILTR